MADPAEGAVPKTDEGRDALLPERNVDLRRAVRIGLLGGLAAVFVSAVGMVEAFETRRVVEALSFAYMLVLLMPSGAGYLAGSPPPQLEGFATRRIGPRNVLAGLIGGTITGAVLSSFVILVGNFDVRAVFPNISPHLVDLLTFGRGLGAGTGLMLLAGFALGATGGFLHFFDGQWRRPLFAALLSVVLFGLLQSLVSQILRGLEATFVEDLLFKSTGALSIPGAVIVAGVIFGLSTLLTHRRVSLKDRLNQMPKSERRQTMLIGLAVAMAMLVYLPQVLGPFLTEVLNIAGIFVLMALGLNIVVGFAGLLDLGYVAFFAIGAYATAVATSPDSPRLAPELVFWEALPFVVLAAAVSGLLVGTPVLRMRGDYLAIVTLGFGEIARILFLSDATKATFGGAQGITRIPDITIGPLEIVRPQLFFYAILAFVFVAAYISYSLQDSRMGRAWMAMREDESVADAMGVNIVAAKLWAFIVGAILASFGGALFAVKIGSIFPHSFSVVVSITVLVVIIVGGLASMPGVILGALVLVGLPELLREFDEFKFLLYGALLIFMMLKRPEGFIPSQRRARELHEEEALQDVWLKAEQERRAPTPADMG